MGLIQRENLLIEDGNQKVQRKREKPIFTDIQDENLLCASGRSKYKMSYRISLESLRMIEY